MAASHDFAAHTRQGFAALGLSFASAFDIAEAHDLAARTVSPNIASVATLVAMQARTGCSSYVLRRADGVLDGALAILPLSRAALADLARGVLEAVSPRPAQVARPGEQVVALYGWGMSALSWRGRATILGAAWRLHRQIHPDLPLYGRAATPGGERSLLKRIGALPVAGPGGLVVAPAWTPLREVA